ARRCARTPPGSHGPGTRRETPGTRHTLEGRPPERKDTMKTRESYEPGPAAGADVRKEGDAWTLVLTRDLRHAPARVWQALTDPAPLREWAPFDADTSLASAGPVKLTTIGAPSPLVSETRVQRADAPKLLEYTWGGNAIRWQLEPLGSGTRLTLWH